MSSSRGFTLIELLVTTTIIGILVALSIPYFNLYRSEAQKTTIIANVRNARIAEESYFAANEAYISCTTTTCPARLAGFMQNAKTSVSCVAGSALGVGVADGVAGPELITCSASYTGSICSKAGGYGSWQASYVSSSFGTQFQVTCG
jgi:prepilin-type N-terminal cleavage/methylation domain-containing protein